jgi:RNA polymerase sigma-70 factor (ECF subfamily)
VSPDADLLQAAHAGDAASFGLLLERYRPRLMAIAWRMLGYGPNAEDAVHDAYLAALRHLSTLDDPLALRAWLDTIIRNVCRMYLRAPRSVSLDARPPGSDPVAVLDDPEEALDRVGLKDWVWKALLKLPETLRVTVLLRHFSSFPSYEQIAELLAVPVGTVRSRLAEGRRLLAESLEGGSREADPEERRNRDHWNLFYRDAFSRLYDGRRDEFLAHYRGVQEIVAGRKRFPGHGKLEFEIDGDLETGTLTEPVELFTSGNLTVMDCKITNPPDDPTRCRRPWPWSSPDGGTSPSGSTSIPAAAWSCRPERWPAILSSGSWSTSRPAVRTSARTR